MKTIIIIAIAGLPIFMASQSPLIPSEFTSIKSLVFHHTDKRTNLNVQPAISNVREGYPFPVKLTMDLESTRKSAGKSCQIELTQTSNPYSFRLHITKSNNKDGVAMVVSHKEEAPVSVQLQLTAQNGDLVKFIPHLSSEANEKICFDQLRQGKYLLQFFAGDNNEKVASYDLIIF